MRLLHVADKGVHIADQHANVLCGATWSWGRSMPTRIRSEDIHICQAKRLDCLLPAAGVLVPAMEKEHRSS
jgi:hypothetical protein